MSNNEYYKILNINKSADEQTIKKAYKRLAFKYHPDHNQGNKAYEEKFKEITAAYEVLIDPQKRAMYDGKTSYYEDEYEDESNRYSSNRYNFHSNDHDEEDEYDRFFGFGNIFKNRNRYSPEKGDNIEYIEEISLEEAFKGVKKNINYLYRQLCKICNGIIKFIKCTKCHGTGIFRIKRGLFNMTTQCDFCYRGQIRKKKQCKYCTDGYIQKNKNLYITFGAGIDNNQIIKIAGEGDESREGQNGDLLIKIKLINHPFFKRNKNDLYCDIPISFITAALGGEIQTPSFSFINTIKLKIPSETQTNKVFRIPGLGLPNYTNNDIRGDIYCKIIVEIPINLNNKQKNLLKKLEDTFDNNGTNFPKIQKFLTDKF